eukprot:COSAG02_NODE_67484_length_253_cov_0.493506_1_plen_20_part_10
MGGCRYMWLTTAGAGTNMLW